jgi:tRNA(Ile2) C34 agmatinyltransferase TiaS
MRDRTCRKCGKTFQIGKGRARYLCAPCERRVPQPVFQRGSVEVPRGARRRYGAMLRREEAGWAARSGPVTVRKISPGDGA